MLVEHMILSHHGRYEFGSPKLPMTPEAVVLSALDDLEAKMQTMRGEFGKELANGKSGAGDDGVGAEHGTAAAELAGVFEGGVVAFVLCADDGKNSASSQGCDGQKFQIAPWG